MLVWTRMTATEQWSDLECTLRVEPTGFSDRSNMRCERTGAHKDD